MTKTTTKTIKAYVVIVDGEICHLQGSQLQVYTSKVFPNKYQEVVPCEISYKLIKTK